MARAEKVIGSHVAEWTPTPSIPTRDDRTTPLSPAVSTARARLVCLRPGYRARRATDRNQRLETCPRLVGQDLLTHAAILETLRRKQMPLLPEMTTGSTMLAIAEVATGRVPPLIVHALMAVTGNSVCTTATATRYRTGLRGRRPGRSRRTRVVLMACRRLVTAPVPDVHAVHKHLVLVARSWRAPRPAAVPSKPPGCAYYSAPPILFMTMYVYVSTDRVPLRVLQELLIVLVPVLEPLALVLLLDPEPTSTNYTAMAVGQIQLLAAYLTGRAVVQVCRVAVGRQLDTQRTSYEEFFTFLHSHVKAGLASVRAVQPDTSAMLEKLEELEQAVSDRRLQMLFVHERIPLAVVISERTRAFTGKLVFTERPRVGVLTVTHPVGRLINRALGDLLKNVLLHGGRQVKVSCSVLDDSLLVLKVLDNGPGFDPTVLDDPAKSLSSLRDDARSLNGDLTRDDVDEWNRMKLTVPLLSRADSPWRFSPGNSATRRSGSDES